jgi:uncharacterized membrane protein (UPF0127 family)
MFARVAACDVRRERSLRNRRLLPHHPQAEWSLAQARESDPPGQRSCGAATRRRGRDDLHEPIEPARASWSGVGLARPAARSDPPLEDWREMRNAFLDPLLRRSSSGHALVNQRNGAIVADRVLTALDSRSRRTGLLTYTSLPDGAAMVIAPTNAIHTFFMRFPIDVAFVTRDGRVVKTCSSVRPWRIAVALRAFAVVELPPGTLTRWDTVPGDRLVVHASSSDRE